MKKRLLALSPIVAASIMYLSPTTTLAQTIPGEKPQTSMEDTIINDLDMAIKASSKYVTQIDTALEILSSAADAANQNGFIAVYDENQSIFILADNGNTQFRILG